MSKRFAGQHRAVACRKSANSTSYATLPTSRIKTTASKPGSTRSASCTMKYNPKINEELASLPVNSTGFIRSRRASTVQGALKLYHELQGKCCRNISGLCGIHLEPVRRFARRIRPDLMIMKAYHESRGDFKRTKVLVPDSAHGTNPAIGRGLRDASRRNQIDARRHRRFGRAARPTSAMRLPASCSPTRTRSASSNPTSSRFRRLVHQAGGLLYYDGANLNALLGMARPGDMGFDIMHINLHKTFSTPHGGGGPDSGPVGVTKALCAVLAQSPRRQTTRRLRTMSRHSQDALGQISGFFGNFKVYLRAYAYIPHPWQRAFEDGLVRLRRLNANYVKEQLKTDYYLPDRKAIACTNASSTGSSDQSTGVKTLDVAKRLLDFGFHAPTIYFPLLFHQSIMIEPTEVESKQTLDDFIAAMRQVALEAKTNPDLVKAAPHTTPIIKDRRSLRREKDDSDVSRLPQRTRGIIQETFRGKYT
ncbi:MAG: aminomethyl-transferring glycine dehydrogenase subunit GcvPB [Bacillus subtilis]|nr:aminomethyl-transferring glycine dehydrogenase subunit GcvPB [Bacillus subtilis]